MSGRRPFFALLFFITLFSLSAQYDPGISWKYVDTEYNRIIFPDFMLSEGLRVAELTEQVRPLITETMAPSYFHKYPVILTGTDMTSNGYVTLFPRRGVWYTFNRGFGSGTAEWYDHLAVHEGRHTVQFDKLNSSAGHILFLLGGEAWYGLAVGITPPWVYEGDAIAAETRYSASGRGRLGSYFALIRSLALEERDYSYYKMALLSYKDAEPSSHALGYPFVNWLETEYGPDAGEALFAQAATLPLPLLGPARAVKKLTGLPPRKAYREMMADLKAETQEIIAAKGPLKAGTVLSPEPAVYTSYRHIMPGPGTEYYVMKADYLHPGALYRGSEEGEKKSFSPVPATRIDGGDRIFVWDSVRTDNAWPTRQEADLYLKEGENRACRLTEGGRYYHPALSKDGNRIAALEWTPARIPRLVILDRGGQIIRSVDFPSEITYASWPVWEGEELILLVQNRFGEAIWQYGESGFTPLIPFTTEDLGHPEPWRGGVFFSLDRYEGREICYLKEGVVRQVTVSPLGSDWPRADEENGRLLFIAFDGSLGESVRSLPLEETGAGPVLTLNPVPSLPHSGLAGFAGETGKTYEVQDYRAPELYSPVGWGVMSMDLSSEDLEIPFALVSADPMQTLIWETGLYYNINEETLGYRFSGDLALFMPRLTTSLSLDERIREGKSVRDFSAAAGLALPLGCSRGRDSFSLDLTGQAFFLNSWTTDDQADMTGFIEKIVISHSRSGGYRSLQPRFEESLDVSLLHSAEDASVYRFSSSGHLLLPGFFPAHGTGFYAYFEDNPELLTSLVPAVRGHSYDPLEKQIMAKAEYLLPLFYPDVALGGLAYLPRISAELFIDRAWTGEGWDATSTSAGCELLGDAFFLTLPVQIRGGVRFSWQWETETPAIQVIIKGFTVIY